MGNLYIFKIFFRVLKWTLRISRKCIHCFSIKDVQHSSLKNTNKNSCFTKKENQQLHHLPWILHEKHHSSFLSEIMATIKKIIIPKWLEKRLYGKIIPSVSGNNFWEKCFWGIWFFACKWVKIREIRYVYTKSFVNSYFLWHPFKILWRKTLNIPKITFFQFFCFCCEHV